LPSWLTASSEKNILDTGRRDERARSASQKAGNDASKEKAKQTRSSCLICGTRELAPRVRPTKREHSWKKLSCKAMTDRPDVDHLANAGAASQRIAACPGKSSKPLPVGSLPKPSGQKTYPGKVDILPRAITREFEEEAPGYKIIPGTIQRVEDEYRSKTDHMVFFRAEAIKMDNIVKIDDNSFRETIGTFELNITNLIEDYEIDINHFWKDEGKLTVKQAILEEAVKQGVIKEVPKRDNPQWDNYFRHSYNVKSLVQRIREVVRQKQAFSWRLCEVGGIE
jgi:hypothetical protein